HTGADLLTTKQQERIAGLFADSSFTEVEVTWAVYQDIVNAYRTADRNEGKKLLRTVIDALTTNLPTGLVELKRLGRTLKRRAADVLAFFSRPGTSNGPTEAINGRLEHLRGSALGFRNITHYIARCLLESGGFRPVLHSQLR
ncbi:transposase, partial [Brevibacterium aurantiacum]